MFLVPTKKAGIIGDPRPWALPRRSGAGREVAFPSPRCIACSECREPAGGVCPPARQGGKMFKKNISLGLGQGRQV